MSTTKTYDTADVAKILKCNPRTVRKWCDKYEVGTRFSTKNRATWILSEEDIEFLRAIKNRNIEKYGNMYQPMGKEKK